VRRGHGDRLAPALGVEPMIHGAIEKRLRRRGIDDSQDSIWRVSL